MRQSKSIISLIIFLLTALPAVSAQERTDTTFISHTDSVLINFRQSKWNLDLNVGNNAAVLDSIDQRLSTIMNDSVFRLRHVKVYGGASPEGSVAFNKFLSEHRAETLFGWFDKYKQLTDLDKTFTFYGRDWEGVWRLAEKDRNIPYRDETMALLTTLVNEKRALGGEDPKRSLERMKQLRGGVPYQYLYRNIFPTVRASKVVIDYERILAPEIQKRRADSIAMIPDTVYVDRMVYHTDTIYFNSCPERPFYMDISTNMLYDLLAIPNIGVEFYLGKNWSLGGQWYYGWWRNDRRHRYWRLYGGDLVVRKWFGKAAEEKPLTGHHLGLYGGIVTYDFEWGGKGYMGGIPGGTLWDRCMYFGGIEYGYSLPVARRFNIDFTIGVGYLGGKLVKYNPVQNHYVWESTSQFGWFGPTKLEISLVWLIGTGNYNKSKGGDR